MSREIPALFETLRAEDGHIPRLERHLARLLASSRAFGVPFDPMRARLELENVGEGLRRVRMELQPDGQLVVESHPLEEDPFRTAWICPEPMLEAGGRLCRHKTTDREHYEWRWRAARARGADEAILLNRQGEVVEGTRTNVWIEREGQLLTPPLTAGGLPGVERAHLLDTRSGAAEAVLTPVDLEQADAVWLSNALRGLMRVELVTGENR